MHRHLLLVFWALLTAGFGGLPRSLSAEHPVQKLDYNRDIKPILSNNCFRCHGPDAKERKGGSDGLRLDTADGAAVDLGGYQAIVPGNPDKSALIARVTSQDADEQMPPKSSGKQLSDREIAQLKLWIRQGAKYASHWSYVKPVRPALPAVAARDWPRNELDYFILNRLEREGLKPSAEADRAALIRRVSLDVTGLPPTIAEVDAFLADTDPQAYEKLVDRLLQKPAYGEHWARMWLDLARYADSAGYADDPPRTIWLYRDYVIRSFNANKPFDQFTLEQIAGDLLPHPTEDQLVGTAFHRNTLTNNEGGTNDEEFRNVAVVDRVSTTMAVWMGTTINCAQCHDHKYDPLSQEEFFRFFAFFNQSEDADLRDESPLLSVFDEDQKKQRAALQGDIAKVEQSMRGPLPELKDAQARWEQAFPLDLKWTTLKPSVAKSQEGIASTVSDDGAVHFAAGARNDRYTIDAPLPAAKLRAVRLEALPDDALPGKGPGYADGNFLATKISAAIVPPAGQTALGRYVRIELPGHEKTLSLAEVQVFHGADNVALLGEARQSSTDNGGLARLAIDGITDGRYHESTSTTKTFPADNPWWEVDLKSQTPINRIVIFNRTDEGTVDRLKDFRIFVLDEKRATVWQRGVSSPPKPSVALAMDGPQPIELEVAVADYAPPGLTAPRVLKSPEPQVQNWSVAGETGRPHALTLVAGATIDVPAGSQLRFRIENEATLPNLVLAHFRLSVSDDARAAQWGGTPLAVLDALQTAAAQRSAAQQDVLARYYPSIAPELQPSRDRVKQLNKQLAGIKPITVPVMRDFAEAKHRVTKIQHRGNYLDVGAEVTAGTPAVFPPLPSAVPRDRLALAKWLVDPNNPLTARVIANRYWEQIFGIGIVASSEEFGSQGEPPSHPEMLDWLATELQRLHWDMKAFVKLLVTSAAYRQTSLVTPELEARDPDNRLLARGPRFRLSAETVRDQALFASGLLSPKLYGPPVQPPQPSLGLSAAFGSKIDWQTSAGDDRYRRALYTSWRRSNPYPSMATFDAPNREVCTVRRTRTNTPLQALVTMNDPVYIEAAQALARRMVAAGGSSPTERARLGFRLCLARVPHDEELARLVKLYETARAQFEKNPVDATRMATDPAGPAPKDANLAELAAWTVVGNVLLNLDETLMKR